MRLLTVLLCCLLFSACLKQDTCNTALGDTFQALTLSSATLDANGQGLIRLLINGLDTLPSAYYQAANLEQRQKDPFGNDVLNTWEALDRYDFSAQEFLLYFKASALPISGSSQHYAFYFGFPDRMDYINCFHPGRSDAYRLELSFDLARDANGTLRANALKWKEFFDVGGY